MKSRLFLYFFCFTQLYFAQTKKPKCKLLFDKTLGVEVYNEVDSVTGYSIDDANSLDDFAWIQNFDSEGLTKSYPPEQRVEVSLFSNPDGSLTLIKVRNPIGDKQIEQRIKVKLASMPKQKGRCWCGGKMVSCVSSISFKLYPKTKCKKTFDKQLGMEIYTDLDTAAQPVSEHAFNEFFNAEVFKDLKATKKYPSDQMVKIAFMIGLDGKASLIKVLEPKDDKEITQEAQIIVNFIPLHRPCKCGELAVPCVGNISFPLYSNKK